jgi:hypothetical protein
MKKSYPNGCANDKKIAKLRRKIAKLLGINLFFVLNPFISCVPLALALEAAGVVAAVPVLTDTRHLATLVQITAVSPCTGNTHQQTCKCCTNL